MNEKFIIETEILKMNQTEMLEIIRLISDIKKSKLKVSTTNKISRKKADLEDKSFKILSPERNT
jgi:hypothetical protein